MKKLTRLFGLMLLMVPVLGCDEGQDEAPEQQVFFEVNYRNDAWGSQHRGFLIDKDGKIRKYDDPQQSVPVSESGGLTAAQLNASLANTVVVSETIQPADLHAYIARIGTISDSSYTKPIPAGADIGIIRYYAYRYDNRRMRYFGVLVKQAGDVSIASKDKSAQEIADWLTGISAKIY